MSLGINTVTSEGLVLAADSRQSYRNQKGMSRIGSDSASKVFKLSDRVGVVVAGLAFLPEGGTLKNISRFVDDFKATGNLKEKDVEVIAKELEVYFKSKYDYKLQLKNLSTNIKSNLQAQGASIVSFDEKETHVEFTFLDPKKIEKKGMVGVDPLQFMVAGFNKDGSHQVAMVYIPGDTKIVRDSKIQGREYGAGWIGQTDVISRVVLGFDARIQNLPFMNNILNSSTAMQIQSQLAGLEYSIQWGTMTLQDGIDFSLLAIDTTTAIQRFSDGIKADPGDMPGVGGAIDVAVITRDKGFVWVSKKKLVVGDSVLDLEAHANII